MRAMIAPLGRTTGANASRDGRQTGGWRLSRAESGYMLPQWQCLTADGSATSDNRRFLHQFPTWRDESLINLFSRSPPAFVQRGRMRDAASLGRNQIVILALPAYPIGEAG